MLNVELLRRVGSRAQTGELAADVDGALLVPVDECAAAGRRPAPMQLRLAGGKYSPDSSEQRLERCRFCLEEDSSGAGVGDTPEKRAVATHCCTCESQ